MNKNGLKLALMGAVTIAGIGAITMAVGLSGIKGTTTSIRQEITTQTDSELFSAHLPLNTDKTSQLSTQNKLVKGLKVNASRVITIATEIDYDSMRNATAKLQDLDQTDGEIYVLLSSPGGSVLDGEAFISAMESARNKVNTICSDLCASMAAIIHQHGAKRYAYDRAILMFHDASGGAQGEVGKMMSMLSFIQRKLEKTNRYIAKRSGIKYEQFEKMIIRDLWIDAEDSKNIGLVDDIIKVIPNVPQDLSSGFFGRKAKASGDANNGKVITVVPMSIGVTNK